MDLSKQIEQVKKLCPFVLYSEKDFSELKISDDKKEFPILYTEIEGAPFIFINKGINKGNYTSLELAKRIGKEVLPCLKSRFVKEKNFHYLTEKEKLNYFLSLIENYSESELEQSPEELSSINPFFYNNVFITNFFKKLESNDFYLSDVPEPLLLTVRLNRRINEKLEKTFKDIYAPFEILPEIVSYHLIAEKPLASYEGSSFVSLLSDYISQYRSERLKRSIEKLEKLSNESNKERLFQKIIGYELKETIDKEELNNFYSFYTSMLDTVIKFLPKFQKYIEESKDYYLSLFRELY